MNAAELRRRISYLPQSAEVFSGTIRENLQLACDCNEEEIWEELRRFRLSDQVSSMPQGLDTQIGESGLQLSGGEIQRLCLARAALLRPTTLVLDEPTSALDHESERHVARALQDLASGLSVVLITHRPEIIQTPSLVIDFEGGIRCRASA
jgi:ABC-type multidrug transport system fused ATPase/permease subunit